MVNYQSVRSAPCDIHVAQPSIPQKRAGDFKDTQVVARFLFVSHQNATPSIEPAQGALDHPTSRLPLVLLNSFVFDRADVPDVVVVSYGGMPCGVVVALIQADVLFVLSLRRALNDHRLDRLAEQLRILYVGSRHDDS